MTERRDPSPEVHVDPFTANCRRLVETRPSDDDVLPESMRGYDPATALAYLEQDNARRARQEAELRRRRGDAR